MRISRAESPLKSGGCSCVYTYRHPLVLTPRGRHTRDLQLCVLSGDVTAGAIAHVQVSLPMLTV